MEFRELLLWLFIVWVVAKLAGEVMERIEKGQILVGSPETVLEQIRRIRDMLGAGILAIGPLQALAQDDDNGGWVDDALDELVDDGTLTQDQADVVADALEEARPEHRAGRVGPWWPGKFLLGPSLLGDAADVIGVDEDELLDALGEGDTIAELAEENGVDPQTVIDAVVDSVRERLDEAVADGDIE